MRFGATRTVREVGEFAGEGGRARSRRPGDRGRATQARIGLRTSTRTFSGGTYTTTGSSRQPRHHTPKPRHQNRSSPHRRPDPATLPTLVSPALPAFLPRPLEQLTPLASHPHPAYLICAPRPTLPPPRLRSPELPAWAGPSRFYLDSRGSGVRREAADPTSSLSPGGKPRKHPQAGRRPVALREETHRTKQMEGNTRRETVFGARSASLRAASSEKDRPAQRGLSTSAVSGSCSGRRRSQKPRPRAPSPPTPGARFRQHPSPGS